MAILSIQSHVAYGYVGNRAAIFPLESMGYEVWQVNTVQFSSHTGYKSCNGDIFTEQHVRKVILGLEELTGWHECIAILSGYLGAGYIGEIIRETVSKVKSANNEALYLCDTVIGDRGRGVFIKNDVLDFFKRNLKADIITPNHFEAEILSDIKINNLSDAKNVINYFHTLGIKIVIIKSLIIPSLIKDKVHILISDQENLTLVSAPFYNFDQEVVGAGDLFASLFLGKYLLYKDISKTMLNVTSLMDQIMNITYTEKAKEMKLLNIDYKSFINNSKIKYIDHLDKIESFDL